MSAEKEIINLFSKLEEKSRRLLVQYAKLLEARQKKNVPPHDRSFWEGLSNEFSPADVKEMDEAIRDCEKVDEESWR